MNVLTRSRAELLGDVLEIVCDASDAALARIWLLGPGDECSSCPMRPECPDQARCLHLEAGAGLTRHIGGQFRRFPLGARRVGEVALTLAPFVELDALPALGLADPAWLATHRILSFGAFPIASGERCLGVMAVFSRRRLSDADTRLLAVSARHAAIAVSVMRAVEEREARRAPAPPPPTGADATGDPEAHEAPERAPERAPALRTLAEIERAAIERVLLHTAGRVSGPRGAAVVLGLKPTTLESRMKKLGVRKPRR
jgi:transcriptional regulator with GAF, ATPase, and Fis domain